MSRAHRSVEWTPLLFSGGLAFLLFSLFMGVSFGNPPMQVGGMIHQQGAEALGAANLVTAVVLGYRGIDTLGELAILFAAATAVGLVLRKQKVVQPGEGIFLGELFDHAVQLLPAILLLVGFYIIFHGHLTPGGGFQGGVIVAVALYLPALARVSGYRTALSEERIRWMEGGAGALFIVIGIAALLTGDGFLSPMLGQGVMGSLLSAGTLPVLYLAVGLKVGSELAGLLLHLSAGEDSWS